MRNKGFSLIEFLVAMGIGSIVLLMVSIILVRGTGLFRTQNDEVNMRNDYQIIRNQLDEAIMEAKILIVEEQGEDIIIYTGDINRNTRELVATNKTTEKVITYDKSENSIYISGTYADHLSEGNIISDMVTGFSIKLDDCSKRVEKDSTGKDVEYYVNPVRVNIRLKLEQEKSDVDYSYSVNLRNRLKEIVLYKTLDKNAILSSEPNVKSYKVK